MFVDIFKLEPEMYKMYFSILKHKYTKGSLWMCQIECVTPDSSLQG